LSTQPAALNITESELIRRIRAGERKLFHELVRPYERAVYIVAYSVLRNPADAEDVSQETMLKALLHLDKLREEDKFKQWLLQIAVNEARLRKRKERSARYESLSQPEGDAEMFMPRDFADWREIPSEALERAELRESLHHALHAIPATYKEVFILRDVEQLSTWQTAAALGISQVAVKVRLHRARLQLREQLAPHFRRHWTDWLQMLKGKKPW
jgi:RNA polymerase sigma-70 factor (ECF subfamily)